MLRIERLNEDNATVTLKLDGRIVGQWVAILKKECFQVLKRQKQLILNFADVTFIGREGVEILEKLRGQQVECTHCSPFVKELLGADEMRVVGKHHAVDALAE